MIVVVICCFVRHTFVGAFLSFFSVIDRCGHISAFGQVLLAPTVITDQYQLLQQMPGTLGYCQFVIYMV